MKKQALEPQSSLNMGRIVTQQIAMKRNRIVAFKLTSQLLFSFFDMRCLVIIPDTINALIQNESTKPTCNTSLQLDTASVIVAAAAVVVEL